MYMICMYYTIVHTRHSIYGSDMSDCILVRLCQVPVGRIPDAVKYDMFTVCMGTCSTAAWASGHCICDDLSRWHAGRARHDDVRTVTVAGVASGVGWPGGNGG
jgi:hypothetical protein